MVTGKDGAKPQKEYSPGQRPGYKCTYYPARCKRKRSQWNTRSLLPVALSERKLLDSLLPRALPWANFLLGFQPVSAACKPFIQGKTTEFQAKWGNGNNISHHSNGSTRNDTDVSWKLAKVLFVVKNNFPAKFVVHSWNVCVHWIANHVNSFLLFYSLFKNIVLLNLLHSLNACVQWITNNKIRCFCFIRC